MMSLAVSRRAAMRLSSHCVTAVSCAQRAFSAGTLRVGMTAQGIGADANVQFDGQLHPQFLYASRVQDSKCGASDLSLVRTTAPKVEVCLLSLA